jgi:2'-5' RNA ligase
MEPVLRRRGRTKVPEPINAKSAKNAGQVRQGGDPLVRDFASLPFLLGDLCVNQLADRLFLAIPLSADARNSLVEQLEEALPGGLPGRPVPPENWHFTVRFLGATSPDAAERIHDSLGSARFDGEFEVRLRGLGAFRRPARATVLWTGVGEGVAALRSLADRVSGRLLAAGVPVEKRPFSPHLTLARLPRPTDLRRLIGEARSPEVVLAVNEVVLFRSHLGKGPPRYEPLHRYPL